MAFQRGLYEQKHSSQAVSFETTGNYLCDMNSQIQSLRRMPEGQLASIWRKAYKEDPALALRWLFYLRDCRGGIGERQTFRRILPMLNPNFLIALIKTRVQIDEENPSIPIIPYYGRWDDLIELFDIRGDVMEKVHKDAVKKAVVEVLHEQLMMDIKGMMDHKPISLMAKWIPTMSANNSRKSSMSFRIAERLGFREPNLYQSTISELRGYLKIVERDMSARRWDEIDYEKVPNKAAKLYREAFKEHDEERFQRYILKRKNEGSDIDPFILPYGIYQKMRVEVGIDAHNILCQKWNEAVSDIETDRRTIVIPDASMAMMDIHLVEKSAPTCLDLSVSTAIMMGQKNDSKGFSGIAMTFSSKPEMVDVRNFLEEGKGVDVLNSEHTLDLESALEKILQHAVQHRIPSSEIPNDILIISRNPFDVVVRASGGREFTGERRLAMKKNYEAKRYVFPRIIFWNANPASGKTPEQIQLAPNGVYYVSGFNRFLYKAVVSGKLSYSKFLAETLGVERYDRIEELFRSSKDGWSIRRVKLDEPQQPKERKKLLPHEKALKVLEHGPRQKQQTDTRRKRPVQKYKGGHSNGKQQHAYQKGSRYQRP